MNVYYQKRTIARFCCAIALWMLLPGVSAFADGTNVVGTETNSVLTVSNVVAAATNDVLALPNVLVANTNSFAPTLQIASTTSNFQSLTGSFVRMLAGLAFVLALFFGGVWLFKNWQRVARVRNKSKLNVLESRSLGPRQAIYVVGYNEQRFLVAASQTGISLLSTLPTSEIEEVTAPVVTNGATSFAQVLQNVLGRK